MRKVDIQARVHELDRRLHTRRDMPSDQAAERSRLIEACRAGGDHVPARVLLGALTGVAEVCEFCGHQQRATREQISRGLVIG
jgi:hypothetical protein